MQRDLGFKGLIGKAVVKWDAKRLANEKNMGYIMVMRKLHNAYRNWKSLKGIRNERTKNVD